MLQHLLSHPGYAALLSPTTLMSNAVQNSMDDPSTVNVVIASTAVTVTPDNVADAVASGNDRVLRYILPLLRDCSKLADLALKVRKEGSNMPLFQLLQARVRHQMCVCV